MVQLISFILAATSFLNEMNLAQTLSASLGGTALRYQTTFGLFTFFLGFGALVFDSLKAKFDIKKILVFSQIGMIIVGLVGPFWIILLDPLSSVKYELPLSIFCYLPICFCGLISGLELPALMSLENKQEINKFKVLAWDYIGMFVSSVAFSFWLLYSFGIYGISIISSLLSFLGLLIIYLKLNNYLVEPESVSQPIEKSRYSYNVIFLFFTLSFCSFSYELILAKILGDIFNDETLAYSLGIGFLILGLGFGAIHAEKIKRPLESLIKIEFLIIIICSILFTSIHILAALFYSNQTLSSLHNYKLISFIMFSPFPLLIGYLTGLELPLLLKLFPKVKEIGLPISLNYTGALCAGFLVPLMLLPKLGIAMSIELICSLNIIAALTLVFMQKNILNLQTLLLPFILVVFFLPFKNFNKYAEQLFLKTYYYKLNLNNYSLSSLINFKNVIKNIPNIERKTSVYQNIDFIKKYDHPFFGTEGNSLYLNKQPQFDSSNWKTYHQSMAISGLNISSKIPKNILICGGGDGILAGQLVEEKNILQIDLVELDSEILNMALTRYEFTEINKNSLKNPKVNIIRDDAFRYLKKTKKKYDAIYLDFPYPDNFELSRLYSVQFYEVVLKALNPNGFMIMDAPIRNLINKKPKYVSDHKTLKTTLSEAGFKSTIGFGSIEPFIYASPKKDQIQFNYDKLPINLPNRTFVNLLTLDLQDFDKNKIARSNSMYLPTRFFRNE